jgi:hypothetical protein
MVGQPVSIIISKQYTTFLELHFAVNLQMSTNTKLEAKTDTDSWIGIDERGECLADKPGESSNNCTDTIA